MIPQMFGTALRRRQAQSSNSSMLPNGVENTKIDPDKCYWNRLPLELKREILGLLYHRPAAIRPFKPVYRDTMNVPIDGKFTYRWAGCKLAEDLASDCYKIAWRETPSDSQLALIEASAYVNDDDDDEDDDEFMGTQYDPEMDSMVQRYVFRRGKHPPHILCKTFVAIDAIQGINCLQVSKEMLRIGSEILYGSNTFVFDTSRMVFSADTFAKGRSMIPGHPDKEGNPMSEYRAKKAIRRIFNQTMNQQAFCLRDPLSKWFRLIGRENASKISRVQLQGQCFTAGTVTIPIHPRDGHDRRLFRFGPILRIQATILGNVCPNLKVLNIDQPGFSSRYRAWSVKGEQNSALAEEEKLRDQFVARTVDLLPTLQKLELGGYDNPAYQPLALAEWGKAIRWEKIVLDRHKERKAHPEKPKDQKGRVWKQVWEMCEAEFTRVRLLTSIVIFLLVALVIDLLAMYYPMAFHVKLKLWIQGWAG